MKRVKISKNAIKRHLLGVNKDLYFLEKIDMYTYRLITYKPIDIHHRLGYNYRVNFDYSAPKYGRFTTYIVSTFN